MEAKKARTAFGKKLEKMRTKRKMTKEFVAESIGVSVDTLTQWEEGVLMIDDDSLYNITLLYDPEPIGLMENLDIFKK